MRMKLERLANPWLLDLAPYSPGKPISEVKRELGLVDIVKMASNENPLGPSPKGMEAYRRLSESLHLYPDGACFDLKQGISSKYNLSTKNVVVGNGSDELLHMICQIFLNQNAEVVFAYPSFIMYEIAAKMFNSTLNMVPLKDFRHDLDAMLNRVNDRTRLFFICNPNNPTGTFVKHKEIVYLLEKLPDHVHVVLDEAYVEYVADSEFPNSLELLGNDDRLIVLRTFSKIYGLAGLRVGYGLMNERLVELIDRVRGPFNVNSAAQAAAAAALEDDAHAIESARVNREGLMFLTEGLQKMGLFVVPSEANFLFFDAGRDSRTVFQKLLVRGVIVRSGDIFGFPTYLRVTTGLPEHNLRFLAALREALDES